ncbi:uncharacterized protein K452DRAFT_9675 [Aplosporella prunicola CBS 121167]|uniref:Uncharacterized protein n=1 Tax=Aplosporella prunicola CBS 121167 TaxID=1176127 RepID=A0A6A6BGJ9_9PEZI|nr:uncharacterized protein K452DRAFT_9675 [Aplosporella prunicola CBS 121167]KAF2142718.1 hypothetical protein K452DRAFT_9675 [Aplosporella prunicola CBS 121167]
MCRRECMQTLMSGVARGVCVGVVLRCGLLLQTQARRRARLSRDARAVVTAGGVWGLLSLRCLPPACPSACLPACLFAIRSVYLTWLTRGEWRLEASGELCCCHGRLEPEPVSYSASFFCDLRDTRTCVHTAKPAGARAGARVRDEAQGKGQGGQDTTRRHDTRQPKRQCIAQAGGRHSTLRDEYL